MRVAIVKIYDASFPELAEANPSSENAPGIASEVMDEFEQRLQKYGYELNQGSGLPRIYKYTKSKGWSLNVEIEANEIRFSAPLTKSYNSSMIFECLQTASELCDSGKIVVFHVKDKEWIKCGP